MSNAKSTVIIGTISGIIILIILTFILYLENNVYAYNTYNFIATTEEEVSEFINIIEKKDGYKLIEKRQIKENEVIKYVIKYKTKEKKQDDVYTFKTKDENVYIKLINLINKSKLYDVIDESYNFNKEEYTIKYIQKE